MKKTKILITLFLFVMFSIVVTKTPINAAERTVIYFGEHSCLVCSELNGYPDGLGGSYNESEDYIKIMRDQGITVIKHDILTSAESSDLYTAYNTAYGISNLNSGVPIIFVGDTYFNDIDDIRLNIDNLSVFALSANPLREVTVITGQAFDDITGIAGYITVLFAGLLDGFNPCAIAMLLLFVSLLGFSENKKVLILVSITYIFALFISYFLIGIGFLAFLTNFASEAFVINRIIKWFVAILCLFLFFFNLYDFFMTKAQKYGKVKNQLPKWIQRYNKKLIKAFTNLMNDQENKRGLIIVLILTFVLGIALSITELICTGQIYFGILYGINQIESGYAYFALLSYNIMFVLPLIVIAVIAIKGRGVMSTSNWIREHLHIIKLLNALLFLTIATYYFFLIFR